MAELATALAIAFIGAGVQGSIAEDQEDAQQKVLEQKNVQRTESLKREASARKQTQDTSATRRQVIESQARRQQNVQLAGRGIAAIESPSSTSTDSLGADISDAVLSEAKK